MKDSLGHRIRQKGCEAYTALCKPTLQHSLRCHCGIYPGPGERSPIMAVRWDCSGAYPLIRILAVLGAIAVLAAVACSVRRAVRRRLRPSKKADLA